MARPRGFIENWRPQRKTVVLLDAVKNILVEYADYLPLTIRQIFYRLVGIDIIKKDEKSYESLCELLNRARRARVIGMKAIRDDGFTGGTAVRLGYTGMAEFERDMGIYARSYRRDRQGGQERRIVLWCEASGMVPQLQRVANDFGVAVKSSGGFDSTTAKHAIGEALHQCVILHVGDYDPSGECMYDALSEDITAFADDYGHVIDFERIAVTTEQIEAYSLPTAPPKKSTHQQRKAMTQTTQAEALDPATLALIVRDAIEARMDMEVFRQVVETEDAERAALLARLEAA